MTSTHPARRRGRWRRPRNIILLVVVALAVWLGVAIRSAVTAVPGASIDYSQELRRLVESYLPEGSDPAGADGWALLYKAIQSVEDGTTEFERLRPPGPDESPGPVDFTTLRGYSEIREGYDLESQEQARSRARKAIAYLNEINAFEPLSRLARTPAVLRPAQPGTIYMWLFPELGRARAIARLSAGRMAVASEKADPRELVEAFEHLLTLARVPRQQFTFIDHLVGIAIESLAYGELAAVLIDRQWDEPTLRALLEAQDRQLAWTPPFELAIRGERIATLDAIQASHTDDGKGSGHLILSVYNSWGGGGPNLSGAGSGLDSIVEFLMEFRIANLGGIAFASKRATTHKAQQHYELGLEYVRTPRAQRQDISLRLSAFWEELSPRYAFLEMFLPALDRAVRSNDQITMQRAGIRIQIALEIYRLRHGRYPEALAELAPSVIESVPDDPLTSRPFGYRTIDPAQDPAGRGYLLYTFGLDGEDNQGREHPKNPFGAMSTSQGSSGYDMILNVPRAGPPRPEPEVEPGLQSNPIPAQDQPLPE